MNSQTVRIADMLLRLLFVIQLLLGLLFWTGHADTFVGLHMLIGILFIIDVWFLGVAQGLRANGSIGLTLGTFIIGLLLAMRGDNTGRNPRQRRSLDRPGHPPTANGNRHRLGRGLRRPLQARRGHGAARRRVNRAGD